MVQIWGPIIISATSLLVAVVSLVKSSKAQNLQNKVNELELKIKENEVAIIEQEKRAASASIVEARVICMGKSQYRLKVWNSGNATAYNVTAKFEGNPEIIIMDKEKMPFEELEAKKNFEMVLITHMGSARKFKIMTEWDDKNGRHYSKSQMGDL